MAIVSDILNTIKATSGYTANSLHMVSEADDCLVYHYLVTTAGKNEMHSHFIATSGLTIPYESRNVVNSGEMKDPNAPYRTQVTF